MRIFRFAFQTCLNRDGWAFYVIAQNSSAEILLKFFARNAIGQTLSDWMRKNIIYFARNMNIQKKDKLSYYDIHKNSSSQIKFSWKSRSQFKLLQLPFPWFWPFLNSVDLAINFFGNFMSRLSFLYICLIKMTKIRRFLTFYEIGTLLKTNFIGTGIKILILIYGYHNLREI